MTSVWPALWPPWKRTTMSACSDNQSTILPFPSSPHWAPTTTTLAIPRVFPLQLYCFEHGVFRKMGAQFFRIMPAWRLANLRPGPLASEAFHRIKEAAYRRKQEGGFVAGLGGPQPIDIPRKFVASRRQAVGYARRNSSAAILAFPHTPFRCRFATAISAAPEQDTSHRRA